MKKYINLIVPALLAIAFIALAWVRLVVQNSDLLYEAQDLSFWQPDELYRSQVTAQPGGWLNWVGQYLTQFFYHPGLGASFLIVLWIAIYLLTLYAFRLRWYLCWIALIVPMMLLWAETSQGYAIYVDKAPDWYFVPTLFVLIICLALMIGRFVPRWAGWSWQGICLIAACVMASTWMEDAQVRKPLRTPFYATLDNDIFQREIRMERAAEEGRWSDAIREMRQSSEPPTRSMWLMKNVILLNQGELMNRWLDYPSMTELPLMRDSVIVPMVEQAGALIYYMHGCIEFAYRWSMENMVEYGPSMKRLRMMTRCAIIKEEWDVAEKYLNMLSRTTFHREWAEQQRRLLYHPELVHEEPTYRMAWILSREHQNLLDGDESKEEPYIVKTFPTLSQYRCPELASLSLVYAMQMQDIKLFWNSFYRYVELHDAQSMPILIQQAAYLFIRLEPQSAPRTDFPFDESVVKMYAQFNQRSQQMIKRGYKDDNLAQALRKEFGRSYYWFYFFCRQLKTY